MTNIASNKRWWGLAVVLLATFMDLLDTTIVNVAIPSIQHNLHATYSAIQWVTAGYVLAFSLLLITGGRLGDIFGRKRMFVAGVSGFTLASLLSGIAPNSDTLVIARLVQGAMAAMMVPQILSTIQVTFSGEERGKVVALYSSITGLASIAGPLLGGLLISANLFGWGWRSIFLVNIPIGIIAIIGSVFAMENSRSEEKVKLDMPGVLLITSALLLLVYPLVQGRELGWPLWAYISMLASIPMLGVFLWYESRKNRAAASPLVLFGPFRKRSFWGGLIVMWAIGAGLAGFLFILSLWMQIGLGFSAIHTGLTFLPFTFGISVTAGIVGAKYSTGLGRGIVRAGSALLVASLLLLIFTLHRYGIATSSLNITPALFFYGAGFGLLFVSIFNFILDGLKPAEAGSASGLVNTMQQLGGAMGIAIVGVVLFSFVGNLATRSFTVFAPELRTGLQVAHIPAAAQTPIIQGFQTCFHDRSNEKDPTALPASCKQSTNGDNQDQGLVVTMNDVATKANKQNYTTSFMRSIWIEVGVSVLMLASVSLLPRHVSKPKDGVIL